MHEKRSSVMLKYCQKNRIYPWLQICLQESLSSAQREEDLAKLFKQECKSIVSFQTSKSARELDAFEGAELPLWWFRAFSLLSTNL